VKNVLVFALVLGILGCGSPVIAASDQEGVSTAEPDWPQWRGLYRDGQIGGPKWPDRLDKDLLEPLWRVPLGPSYSGPIVTDDAVFTTETLDREREVVHALDRKTGKQRWRVEWNVAITVPFFAASHGSWIRSTPAYDGECLYVAGMRDVLVCLAADTGREHWRVDFVDRFKTPLPAFGFVCSPLVDGTAVYVQAGASVVKLDKKSGTVLWRVLKEKGDMTDSAFSSPLIAQLAGKRQLLVQTREQLAGVELETGDVLWTQTVPAFRGMNILTPVVVGDTIFTSTYRNQSWLYRVVRDGDGFSVETVWSNKVHGYMSTPVVVGGHVYLQLQNRRFACLDLETGEPTWTSAPFGPYVSLVAQEDRILGLDSRGRLLLIRANPKKFELLADVKVSDAETWAHLAVRGDALFIRELGALAAYRWTPAKTP